MEGVTIAQIFMVMFAGLVTVFTGWVSHRVKKLEDGAEKGAVSVSRDEARKIAREENKPLEARVISVESDLKKLAESLLDSVNKQSGRLDELFLHLAGGKK